MRFAKRLLRQVTNQASCFLLGHDKWHVHPPGMGPPLLWGFDFWTGQVARWRSFDACLRCGQIFMSGISEERPWPETDGERSLRQAREAFTKPEAIREAPAPEEMARECKCGHEFGMHTVHDGHPCNDGNCDCRRFVQHLRLDEEEFMRQMRVSSSLDTESSAEREPGA